MLLLNPVDCSGRREDSSENANAFPSCVGRFEEAQSMSCGISWPGETPQELATRRLSASPEEELLMKKTASGLFHSHILPAESEAPGTEINGLFLQTVLNIKRVPKPFRTPSFFSIIYFS
jgi:hypothetical protein